MRPFSVRWLWLSLLLMSGALLASCETIKGAGRDLENAGEALESALDGA